MHRLWRPSCHCTIFAYSLDKNSAQEQQKGVKLGSSVIREPVCQVSGEEYDARKV